MNSFLKPEIDNSSKCLFIRGEVISKDHQVIALAFINEKEALKRYNYIIDLLKAWDKSLGGDKISIVHTLEEKEALYLEGEKYFKEEDSMCEGTCGQCDNSKENSYCTMTEDQVAASLLEKPEGEKDDSIKPDWSLLNGLNLSMEEIGKALHFGARKYEQLYLKGEVFDPKSKAHQYAVIALNYLFLAQMYLEENPLN